MQISCCKTRERHLRQWEKSKWEKKSSDEECTKECKRDEWKESLHMIVQRYYVN